jgi:hypothetical protein
LSGLAMLGSSLSARLTGAGPAGARLGHHTGLIDACLPGRPPRCETPVQDHVAEAVLDQTRQPRPNSSPATRAASLQAGASGKRDFSDPASPTVPCSGERGGVAHVVPGGRDPAVDPLDVRDADSSMWLLKGSAMPLRWRPMPSAAALRSMGSVSLICASRALSFSTSALT